MTVMRQDDVFDQRQTESGAPGAAATALIDSIEAFEKSVNVPLFDAGAEVLYFYENFLMAHGAPDYDP
jgi:hypothetical protein